MSPVRKAEIWNFIHEYRDEYGDSLLLFAKNNLNNLNLESRAMAQVSLAKCLVHRGDIAPALKLYSEAFFGFEDLEDVVSASEVANYLGVAYYLQESYRDAEKWFLISRDLGVLSNDETVEIAHQVNLAQCYAAQNRCYKAKSAAREYINRCLNLEMDNAVMNGWNVMGKICLSCYELDSARFSFQQAIASKRNLDDKDFVGRSNALTNLAIIAFMDDDMELSENYFVRALEMRKRYNDRQLLSESYLNLGGFYFEMGDTMKARLKYEQGLASLKGSELLGPQIELYKALIEIDSSITRYSVKINELELKQANSPTLDWRSYIIPQSHIKNRNDEKGNIVEWVLWSLSGGLFGLALFGIIIRFKGS